MINNIDLLIKEYIEKRLATKRTPYEQEAQRKVEHIRRETGGQIEDLTKRYFKKADNPTLLGWERFCLLNKG
jgi:hypothetical protein